MRAAMNAIHTMGITVAMIMVWFLSRGRVSSYEEIITFSTTGVAVVDNVVVILDVLIVGVIVLDTVNGKVVVLVVSIGIDVVDIVLVADD